MGKSNRNRKYTRKTKSRLKKKSYGKRRYKKRSKKISKKRRNLRGGAGQRGVGGERGQVRPPATTKRNKLEGALVRLAFAKMLISDPDIINDIILRIGSYLTPECLNIDDLKDKWIEWKETNHPEAPDLDVSIGIDAKSVKFNLDNIEVGRKFKFTAANWVEAPIQKEGNCTIKDIEIRKDTDMFKIILEFENLIEERVLDEGGYGYTAAEMRMMEVEYNKPGTPLVLVHGMTPHWSVTVHSGPPTLCGIEDINT